MGNGNWVGDEKASLNYWKFREKEHVSIEGECDCEVKIEIWFYPPNTRAHGQTEIVAC